MTIERKAGRDGYNTKTFGSIASQLRPWYQRHSEGGIIRTLEVKVQTPIKVDRWFLPPKPVRAVVLFATSDWMKEAMSVRSVV